MLGAWQLERLAGALDRAVAEDDEEAVRVTHDALGAELDLVSAELTKLLQLWAQEAA